MQTPLTHTEVWRLTQHLYTLYNDLSEFSDQIEFEVIDNPDIPDALSIIEINERLNSYQNNPPSLLIEDGLSLPLDRTNLMRLRSYIIENNDTNLALDIIDPYFDSQSVVDYISDALGTLPTDTTCLDYLIFLDMFIDNVRTWVDIRLNQIGSSLEQALASKKNSGFLIFQEHLKRYQHTQRRKTTTTDKTKYKSASDLSHIFTKKLDTKIVIGIYQAISTINYEKQEGYITQIAAVIAEAKHREYIPGTFSTALGAIFSHFDIKEDAKHFRPSRLREPNKKGTPPEVHLKALEILDNLTQQK